MLMVYTCSMVSVYLPMGYPIQTGNEFQNVIYQGDVVRLYTLPTDPRTDVQLENRRFLSDVTKTRSTMGVWGKAACKFVLGSKWASVVYQFVKGDLNGWWSDALDQYDSFGSSWKADWGIAAPYQATFNDNGAIFFGVLKVIYHLLNFYSEVDFFAEDWGEQDIAAAVIWWEKGLEDAFEKGKYDDNDSRIKYSEVWSVENCEWMHGGSYRQMLYSSGASLHYFFYGRKVVFGYAGSPNKGIVNIAIDGKNPIQYDQDYASLESLGFEIDTGKKALHYLEMTLYTEYGSIDYVEVL